MVVMCVALLSACASSAPSRSRSASTGAVQVLSPLDDPKLVRPAFYAALKQNNPECAVIRTRFELAMLEMRFWPAVVNGCAVNGHFSRTFRL